MTAHNLEASTTVAVRFADRTDEEFGIYLGVQRLKFEYSGKHKNREQLKNKLKCNCSARFGASFFGS